MVLRATVIERLPASLYSTSLRRLINTHWPHQQPYILARVIKHSAISFSTPPQSIYTAWPAATWEGLSRTVTRPCEWSTGSLAIRRRRSGWHATFIFIFVTKIFFTFGKGNSRTFRMDEVRRCNKVPMVAVGIPSTLCGKPEHVINHLEAVIWDEV